MFKFSSTHVLNALTTSDSSSANYLYANTTEHSLVVGGNDKFYKSAITKITKKASIASATATASFTMPTLTSGKSVRLSLYVRSTDNADPLYANAYIYKGKPFAIEFTAGANATASAEALVANSAKWLNFVFGKKVIAVTNSGATVTLKVVDGDTNLSFYRIEIAEFDESADSLLYGGVFKTVADWMDDGETHSLTVTATRGTCGFGTYMYMLKNLRYPTNTNTGFYAVNGLAGEMPEAGATYTQYIVEQVTDRPEMQGTSVLGQVNQSKTTHILWVKSSLVSAFEAELTKVCTLLTGEAVVKGVIYTA